MTPQQKAESLGIQFTKQQPGYLAMVVRTGNLLMTSGHVSDMKGKLGARIFLAILRVAALFTIATLSMEPTLEWPQERIMFASK